MNRQRLVLLCIIILAFFMMTGWIVYSQFQQQQKTFLAGVPPQDFRDIILPKTLSASQLHPPALLRTDPIKYGSATSAGAVIEYGDFECADCKEMVPIIERVVQSYKGNIRFVWHDFPITTAHEHALDASILARCAGAQGAFWKAYDALMSAESLDSSTLNAIARSLSLDQTLLQSCRTNGATQDLITQEINVARGDGISQAPTFFIGSKAFIGPITEEELRLAIDAFLKQ